MIEVDFYYDEGTKGGFRPVLRDYTIENISVAGAPNSIIIRGFHEHPTTSYIGITLRNISFTGLTNKTHYVVEDVDYISSSAITIDGVVWDIEPTSSSSAAYYLKCKILLLLFAVILKWI